MNTTDEILTEAVAACAPPIGDHRLLIALKMDLANARFTARDHPAALDDFEEPIPALIATLGPEHRVALECRYNQALSSAALGWNEIARERMTDLLGDVRTSLNEHDALTLEFRREIGELPARTGDHERARAGLRALPPRPDRRLHRFRQFFLS
ncbi:hypothetical protein [Streptosporangium sp. CA-115845]|uniref:hypothetical protein n=1 Tax=Streptosporangium sp. CA-115845 TaxID=3240071 RepID=UPI003D921649